MPEDAEGNVQLRLHKLRGKSSKLGLGLGPLGTEVKEASNFGWGRAGAGSNPADILGCLDGR